MYRTLLSDYDARQRELVLENSEQRKVLQQMKRDMVSLLRGSKPARQEETPGDPQTQVRGEVLRPLVHQAHVKMLTRHTDIFLSKEDGKS